MNSRFLGLLGVMGMSVAAQAGPLASLRSFQIYAVSNIRGLESDFEGATGAGGDISLTHFSLGAQSTSALAVTAGGSFVLQQGTIDNGSAEAANMNLQNAAVRGNLLTMGDFSGTDGNASGKLELGGAAHLARFEVAKGVRKSANLALSANHVSYAQALYAATAEYAALPASSVRLQGTVISFNAKTAFNVFTVTKENLQKARLVNVNASANQVVVINVTGDGELTIDGMDIALRGGVASENVLWNFPRVSRLTIQRSGHSSASDRPGIQGTILAPYAVVNFREALIVGHLFVGMLDDWKGQLNVAPFFRCEDPSSGIVCGSTPVAPQEPFDPGSGK